MDEADNRRGYLRLKCNPFSLSYPLCSYPRIIVVIVVVEGYYGSALAAAAYGGSVETVQLLLDVGADVNQELSCGHYGMAVVAAIDGWDGDMAVVETLLDAGADISRLHTHLERTLVLRSQQPCEIRVKKGDAVKAQWPLV